MKIVEIKKRNFGEDHIEYANSLENLSIVMLDLGDYKEAIAGY
jgi:hypothetical protein